jgi:hypothetical protein
LNQHLVECDNCRSFLKDTQFVSDRVIPRVLRSSRNDEERVPAGMRERFLARAASEGLKIQAGPPVAVLAPVGESEPLHSVPASPQWSMWPSKVFASLRPSQVWAIAGSACMACFVLGMVVVRTQSGAAGSSGSEDNAPQAHQLQAASAAAPVNADADRVRALTAERDRLAQQIADLAHQLQAVEKEKQQTDAASQQRLTAAESDAARDHDSLTQQTASLSARAADLQSQLDTVRQQESLAETDIRNARAKTLEYSARLDLLQTQIRNQDEAALPNPSEINSLVVARNLHIIDVYDSNTSGQRQRAFGRVFLVEGQSLVFYAYDLNAAHSLKNITFHVWGEQAGSKETTLSLGVLHDDDPRERRWALTCDDPKVLAKINSVYVTAESASRHNDAPRGPRVLYAYFGAPPNHP